ncbi:BAD_HP_G0005840.mRNA.1.CDS.1 [Saccharomyces cerevisiae]|nr:BAD_HP_G0005840.mRNA.1.CDS.1 [Saccharomyces cerevisiae]CAI6416249.1 BAD_HP_G0005840.mRNA.1.CDS.1 [Saccharomyces cerevisiae]
MSARKRKFNSLKPLDTLNSSRASSPRSSASLPPKRYNTFRKDPKIVDHLNNASTKDFLPVLSMNSESKRQIELSDNDVDDNDEGEGVNSGCSDQDFEPLQSSPLKRHSSLKSTSNGLLFQMSNNLGNGSPEPAVASTSPNGSIISTKLNLNGQFSCVDSKTLRIYRHKAPCIMTFVSDHNHPKFSLYFQQSMIYNSQVNLLDDVELIILDKKNSFMAIILKDLKKVKMILDVNNSSININTNILIWSTASSASNKKIKSIKRFLLMSYSSSIKVEILDHKEQILERLKHLIHPISSSSPSLNMERAINSTKNAFDSLRLKKTKLSTNDDESPQIHTHFLSNKPHGLQSLTKRTRIASLGKKEHSISVPKSNISPSDFYNTNGTETLQSHAVSQLRRSNRFKDVSNPANSNSNSNSEFDDATTEFETPELFKPSLCYKFNDGSSYTITNQDFKCLFNKDWVNDSILDFFTKFYIESSIEKSIIKREQVHLMSSFFYTKLISNPADYYSNVKKWVNNTDLFSKKYVVIPINISYHWFSCIITNLDAILDFHQNKDKNDAINSDEISINNPLVNILTFDSLRQTHSREIDPIKEFLISYALDKYSIQLDKTQIKMKTCPVPQQPNMSDCGVHVILNIRKFFENPVETIDVWKNSKIKSKHFTAKMINKYFDKNERNSARKNLRHTLKLLQLNYISYLKKENLYEEVMQMEEKKSTNINNNENYDDDDEEIQIIENIDQSSKDNNAQLTSEPPCSRSSSISTTEREPTELHNSVVRQPTGEIITDNEDPVRAASPETASVSPPIRHNILKSSSPFISESANETEQEEFTSPYFGRPSLKTRAKQFEGVSSPIKNDQALSSTHDIMMPSPKPKRIYPSKKIPQLSSHVQSLSTDSMERQSSPNNTNIVISDTEQDSRLGVNSESKNTSGIVNRDDSDVNLIGSSLPNVAEKNHDKTQESNGNNDSLGKILQNVDKELNEKLVDIDDVAFSSPTRGIPRTSATSKGSNAQLLSNYGDENNQSQDSVWDEGRDNPILLEDEDP